MSDIAFFHEGFNFPTALRFSDWMNNYTPHCIYVSVNGKIELKRMKYLVIG